MSRASIRTFNISSAPALWAAVPGGTQRREMDRFRGRAAGVSSRHRVRPRSEHRGAARASRTLRHRRPRTGTRSRMLDAVVVARERRGSERFTAPFGPMARRTRMPVSAEEGAEAPRKGRLVGRGVRPFESPLGVIGPSGLEATKTQATYRFLGPPAYTRPSHDRPTDRPAFRHRYPPHARDASSDGRRRGGRRRFGDDPTVIALEERAAEITGKQAALFVSTARWATDEPRRRCRAAARSSVAKVSIRSHTRRPTTRSWSRRIKLLPWNDEGKMDLNAIRRAFRNPRTRTTPSPRS